MKKKILVSILFFISVLVKAQENKPYRQVAQERADKIVEKLELSDEKKKEKVKTLIASQYVALNKIHTERDQKLETNKAKADEIKEKAKEEVSALHGKYIINLQKLLSKEQIDEVKNGMTYHTVPITYANYLLMLPYATEKQKEMIRTNLTEAREFAMDGGTSKEKHAWFNKYKGRIANELAKQGYDLKKEGNEWAKRRDTKSASLAIVESNKVMQALNLQDKVKSESVRNLVAYQYQQIEEFNKDWKRNLAKIDSLGKTKEEKDKEAAKEWTKHKAALDQQRDQYITKLGLWLDSAQIEIVKNEMTAQGLNKEYERFQELLPGLTAEHKAKVYQYLVEARENALNVLTSRERNQWFAKYRGRANNYLSAQGYNLKKATEELEKRTAKQ
ncbi:DUF3826 domain-containing protein [Pseudopedobacter sp.]|uniref:DUF3826 domain-containing protein n=1 Tax=Pseudopedobacter sp. TaxID=1936787 RepID=UPI0033426DBD